MVQKLNPIHLLMLLLKTLNLQRLFLVGYWKNVHLPAVHFPKQHLKIQQSKIVSLSIVI